MIPAQSVANAASMEIGETAQLEAVVYGQVQGVYFRLHTRHKALGLGLVGYVENRPDGSVHVLAQGEEDDLRSLLAWLQHGPDLARVTAVDVTWSRTGRGYARFEVHE